MRCLAAYTPLAVLALLALAADPAQAQICNCCRFGGILLMGGRCSCQANRAQCSGKCQGATGQGSKFGMQCSAPATKAPATKAPAKTTTGSPSDDGCCIYFDGCNTCGRNTADAPFKCSKMACEQKGTPECKVKCASGDTPSDGCCDYYDGCNACGRETADAPFRCTERACMQKGTPKCNKKCASGDTCAQHGEDCEKCLADSQGCAMMTSGKCYSNKVTVMDAAVWEKRKGEEVKETCAKRATTQKDNRICAAKDLQHLCAKCTSTVISGGRKCVAYGGGGKFGGCGASSGGMRPELEQCPLDDGCCDYYDGCNNCGRETADAPFMCTKMACEQKGTPKCNKKCASVPVCPNSQDICDGKASCTDGCPCPKCLPIPMAKGSDASNNITTQSTLAVTTDAKTDSTTAPSKTALTVEQYKALKELADAAYSDAGCDADPNKEGCSNLRQAKNAANSAYTSARDGEESSTATITAHLALVSLAAVAAMSF